MADERNRRDERPADRRDERPDDRTSGRGRDAGQGTPREASEQGAERARAESRHDEASKRHGDGLADGSGSRQGIIGPDAERRREG